MTHSKELLVVAIVNDDGIFNLFKGRDLEALMMAENELKVQSILPNLSNLATAVSFANLTGMMEECPVDVWYFGSEKALYSLTDEQIKILITANQNGTIFGIAGPGDALVDRLGLPSGKSITTEKPESGSVFFTFFEIDKPRKDFILSLNPDLKLGTVWFEIFTWAIKQVHGPLLEQNIVTAVNDLNPWEAQHTYHSISPIKEGGFSLTFSVYKLKTISKTNDWYRVDLIAQGSTAHYKNAWGTTGWWIDKIDVGVNVMGDGVLIDHMPGTTLTNTTKSFSIGGSLSAKVDPEKIEGGGSVDAKYSESYNCSDLTMIDNSDFSHGFVKWSAKPKGPTYFPGTATVIANPALVAQSSYQYKPSIIVMVGKNKPLEMNVWGSTTLLWNQYIFLIVGKDSRDPGCSYTVRVNP